MKVKLLILSCCFAVFLSVTAHAAEDLSTDTFGDTLNKGKSMIKKVPANPHVSAGEKEAMKILDKHNSVEYQDRIGSEIGRIKNYFETGKWDDAMKDKKGGGANHYSLPTGRTSQTTALAADERIYILVSSSVPMQTLRNYGYAMERGKDTRIKMVLRGFVPKEGSEPPILATKKFIARLISGTDGKCIPSEGCEKIRLYGGIIIDPFIFRRFQVKDNVPAIVYARGIKIKDNDISEGGEDNMKIKESYILRGDVSLDYAIELIQRNLVAKGKKSEGLEKLLAAVRGTGRY